MLRKIHLHGSLGDKFGKEHEYEFDYPSEAVGFLTSMLPGCKAELLTYSHIAVLKATGKQNVVSIQDDSLIMSLGKATDLHFLPVVEGSGIETGAAIAAAVLGVEVAAVSFTTALITTVLVNMAFAFVAGAIVQALSPSPKTNTGGETAAQNSFLFSGVENVSEQGAVVPLKFGRFRGSSVVVSAGTSAYDIEIPPVNTPADPPPTPDYQQDIGGYADQG